MTTDAHRAIVDSRSIDDATLIPPSDSDYDYDYDHDHDHDEGPYPDQPADITQLFYFLIFALKESTRQTAHAFLQCLKCTCLLASELHRPYLDSIRAIVPLWLAVIHAILLVSLVLVHRAITDTIQRLHDIVGGALARFAAWTDHIVPRVFPRHAFRLGSARSSVLHSGPSSIMQG